MADSALAGCAIVREGGVTCPVVGGIRLTRRLGRGGMGVVYVGRHPRLGIDVAVKVLPRSDDAAVLERFLREARIAASLHSEHLVSVLDVDRDAPSGTHYIVMDLVKGRSADQWSGRIGPAHVPERDALRVCLAAAHGLAVAHGAGVLHRDIKPANILIPSGPDGEPLLDRAKLADLGLARFESGTDALTKTSVALGTPGFMAPEQVRDAARAGKAADVFGLGATLYALLTGQAPYHGPTPMAVLLATANEEHTPVEDLRAGVSGVTRALVARCLARRPEDRPSDGVALVPELERALRETSTSPPADRALPETSRPRPHPARWLLVTGVLVACAVVAGLVSLGRPSDPGPGLWVETDPAGALVTIDGVDRGRSPLLVRDLVDGPHTVLLRHPERETQTHPDVTTIRGQRRTLTVALPRPRGRVRVEGAFDGSRVLLYRDGDTEPAWTGLVDRDTGPNLVEAGHYRAVVECPGFTAHTVGRVDVVPASEATIRVPFVDQAGWLDLTQAPREVAWDVGGRPLRGKAPLGAGDRLVTARRQGMRDQVVPVRVVAGQAAVPTLGPWFPAGVDVAIVQAAGTVRIGGRATRVDEGKLSPVASGDEIAADGHVVVRTATGDVVEIDAGTVLGVVGTRDGVTELSLVRGQATVTYGSSTRILSADHSFRATSERASMSVALSPPDGPGARALTVRSRHGTISVTRDPHRVMVAEGSGVTITGNPAEPVSLNLTSAQDNAADVEVRTSAEGGEVVSSIPRATTAAWTAHDGKLRIENAITSEKGGRIRVQRLFAGRSRMEAPIAPGVHALVDAVVRAAAERPGAPRGEPAAARSARPMDGDDVGGQPLPGVVEILGVDRSALATSGRVTYSLSNISGRDHEDLSWTVQFVFAGGDAGGSGIQVESEAAIPAEKALVMLQGEHGRALESVCPGWEERQARGERPLTTRLLMFQGAPNPIVARDRGRPGSRFLAGRLECVAVAPAAARVQDRPQVWVELENVSNQRCFGLEMELEFIDAAGVRSGRTRWVPIPDCAPGERVRVTFDLSRLPDTRTRVLSGKVRQQAL